MKKLILIWLFSGSLDSFCQDVVPAPPIDRMPLPILNSNGFLKTVYYAPNSYPDTIRAMLLVTFNGNKQGAIVHTKPGYVVQQYGKPDVYLDDKKIIIKAPIEVWQYKVKQ